jgi:hypothetical protein
MSITTETRRIELVTENSDRNIQVQPFPFTVQSCKRAFTTRNVNLDDIKTLITGEVKPQAGDLVLCEVTRLRQHCRIEQPNGRRSRMFVKDKIIVCYGHRYAPDQFESIVPDNLDACHLVAGGGVASLMRFKSPKVKPATELQPLGLIGNNSGHILNLTDYSTLRIANQSSDKDIPVILVTGSSMNAGKTTTVASIIRGLTADGYNVGAAKVTGTGSGGDLWHFIDAGVNEAIDFTDAGFASTYLMSNQKLVKVFKNMLMHLSQKHTDVIVIEVADGILQGETKELLESVEIQSLSTAMVYTSGESSSAIYGADWLEKLGYQVLAISGVVSSNPLGTQEIHKSTATPVWKKAEITAAGFGHELMQKLSNKSINTDTKQLHTK